MKLINENGLNEYILAY